jgi:class 3 adenylate cyclase
MTMRLGDTKAMELLRAHDSIIRRCLEHYRGSEIKHLGDGIMASFDDASAAVACAIEIQDKFASYNKNSETPIHVRIGIHAGEPIEERDDLFGSAVQMAARICDIAHADAILVSREVRDACANVDLEFAPAGSEALKGFSESVALFSPAH